MPPVLQQDWSQQTADRQSVATMLAWDSVVHQRASEHHGWLPVSHAQSVQYLAMQVRRSASFSPRSQGVKEQQSRDFPGASLI